MLLLPFRAPKSALNLSLCVYVCVCRFSSSVVLVIDEKEATNERCYILIDTGLPFFKNTVLGGLASHGIRPSDITQLILTHTAVDTVGNLNLFPHTNIFIENKIVNRQFVYIQKTAPSFVSHPLFDPLTILCFCNLFLLQWKRMLPNQKQKPPLFLSFMKAWVFFFPIFRTIDEVAFHFVPFVTIQMSFLHRAWLRAT